MPGFIIYQGASMLDGAPIVAVLIQGSKNTKTGGMLQTHIIRQDISPTEASRTGQDSSICGNCPHRGQSTDEPGRKLAKGRSCYVNLAQGPTQVFKAYRAGKYPDAQSLDEIESLGANQSVRIGSYGDPSAVPAQVWQALTRRAVMWTGYSHQHGTNKPEDYTLSMFSADNPEQARAAHARGYRTFRVIPVSQWQQQGQDALIKGREILCPASKEAGARVQCQDCGLCNGSTGNGKSIAIVAHGIGKGFAHGR